MRKEIILEKVKTWNNVVITALKKELSGWLNLEHKEAKRFYIIRWWRKKDIALIKECRKEVEYWIKRIQTAEDEATKGNTIPMIHILEYSGLICPFHLMKVFRNPWVEKNGWSLFEELCKAN